MNVTLIHPPGCPHCAQVKAVLEKLKPEYPDLKVDDIDMLSEEGQKLVQQYGIMASPGILVNNEYFMSGGATESQLREKLDSLKQG